MNQVGQELLNVPFPQMIENLGVGIAHAQYALDKVSIRITQLMAGFTEDKDGKIVKDDSALIKLQENGESFSLLALGFTPTFYQFTETYIEMKMAISMKKSSELGIAVKASYKGIVGFGGVLSASVNASYSQKYQYEASGSSSMRTKLVTVPVPAIFEQRLRELMVAENTPPTTQ
jgi:hypothetical protein